MLAALTGGIGSGKSTALKMFRELGAATQDTDQIVHDLYKDDKYIHKQLFERWGKSVFLDDQPDKKAIARQVFNHKEDLEWLNGLLHPRVKERISTQSSQPISVIAVPLLYEVGWEAEFGAVISVWCDKSIQMTRLLKRGWSEAESMGRLSCQMDQQTKLTRAEYGIINDWSKEFLYRQCREIFKELQQKES